MDHTSLAKIRQFENEIVELQKTLNEALEVKVRLIDDIEVIQRLIGGVKSKIYYHKSKVKQREKAWMKRQYRKDYMHEYYLTRKQNGYYTKKEDDTYGAPSGSTGCTFGDKKEPKERLLPVFISGSCVLEI
jgi:hypothetical protein